MRVPCPAVRANNVVSRNASRPRVRRGGGACSELVAKRAEAAALAATHCDSAVGSCPNAKRRPDIAKPGTHGVKAGVALLIFVLGYAAGSLSRRDQADHRRIWCRCWELANAVSNIDAAEQAYEKGRYPLALRLLRPLGRAGRSRARRRCWA